MRIFDTIDLQHFLKIAQKKGSFKADLRYCGATVRAKYNAFGGDYTVVLRSYAHDTITLDCEANGRVILADFSPYRSMTTWQHVRKFCTLFQNGRELYSAYTEAAHGGRVNRYFKRG